MTRRRWGAPVLGVLLVATACAHVEPPPGGPEDRTPPALLTSRPEAGAIDPNYQGPVVLVFDERISEQGLEDAVNVSPRTSPVAVDHGRDEIRVSLRQGWQPGVIYHIGVSRDVRDLFNNSLGEPLRLVFSTGPEIPDTRLTGSIVDRLTGRPETEVRVEAIRTDSLVYSTSPDSLGNFIITQFPEGAYRVRAFRDLNRNRALDAFEARDTAATEVLVGEPAEVALRVVDPDSTAPVPGTATLRGRIVQVEFDDYLDPEQELVPTQVSVRDSTGVEIPVDTIALGELVDEFADTVPFDSIAPDSIPPDTIPPDPVPPNPTPPQAGVAQPGVPPGLPPGERPSRTLSVRLAEGTTLAAGAEYTLTIEGVQNIVGLTGGGETTFEAPEETSDPADPQPPGF